MDIRKMTFLSDGGMSYELNFETGNTFLKTTNECFFFLLLL